MPRSRRELSLIVLALLLLGSLPLGFAEPFDPENPYFQTLGAAEAQGNPFVNGKRWASRFSEETLNPDGTVTATFTTGPRTYWSTVNQAFEGLEFRVAPGNGTSQNIRFFARNSHAAVEFYDTSAKLFNPDYTRVSIESEMWDVLEWVTTGGGRWRTFGIGTMTPTWAYTQTADCINVTRIQTIPGTGQFNLTYTLRPGQLLKHTAVYRSVAGGTFEVVMTWNGIASAHVRDSSGRDATITGQVNAGPVQSFSVGENITRCVVYEDLTSVYGSVLKDVVYNTYAGGMKADIVMGDYTLAQGQSLEIDPTTSTFDVSSDDYDGYVFYSGGPYASVQSAATGGSAYTTLIQSGQTYVGGSWTVYRGFIRFDTSSIESSWTILGAELCLDGSTDRSTTDFVLRVQKWTEASDGISTADYNGFDGTNYDDGGWSSSSYVSGYNNITITNFSIIDIDGYTDICIRSQEDVSISEPTDSESIEFTDTGGSFPSILVINWDWQPAEDYVDLDDSNVDSSADIGTSSSFTAQKATDATNDTLTEGLDTGAALSNTTLLNDGFEAAGAAWDDNFDGNGATTWTQGAANDPDALYDPHSGTYKANCESAQDGSLTSDDLDCTAPAGYTTVAIYVEFWYQDDDLDVLGDDFALYFYDGATYDLIADLNLATEDTWTLYSAKITDSQYFDNTFRIRFTANPDNNENAFVDDVLIKREVRVINYKLDLEFQFTNVNYTRTNEQLCIKTGPFTGSEDIKLYQWFTGNSTWGLLDAAMDASAWNNYTVSLTAATFTIRVIGATESSDTTQSTWKIDGNLLHTWATAGTNYPRSASVSLTLSKTGTRLVVATRAPSKAIEFTGTGSRLAVLARAASIAGDFAGSAARVIGLMRAATEDITLTVDATRLAALTRATSAAFTLAQAASRLAAYTRAATEDITLSSAATRVVGLIRGAAQALTLTTAGSRLAELARSATQSLTLGNAGTRLAELLRGAAQSVTFTSAADRVLGLIRGTSIAATLTTAATRITGLARTASQSLTITTAAARLMELFRGATQSLTLNNAASVLVESIQHFIADVGITITAATAGSRLAELSRGASIGAVLTSAGSRLAELARVATQGVAFTSAADRVLGVIRGVSQAIGLTTAGSRFLEAARGAAQSLDFAGLGTRLAELTRAASQGLGLTSAASRIIGFIRSATQGITLSSATDRLLGLARGAAQSLSLSTAAQRLLDALRGASQNFTLNNAASAILDAIEHFIRGAGITISTTLNAGRLGELIRGATQGLTLSTAGSRLADLVRAAAQSLSLTSAGTRIIGFVRSAVQGITLTSAASRFAELVRGVAVSTTFGSTVTRIYEALRGVTQSITFTSLANAVADTIHHYIRGAGQAIAFAAEAERQIGLIRAASEAITFLSAGAGHLVINFIRGAGIAIDFFNMGTNLAIGGGGTGWLWVVIGFAAITIILATRRR